jgi:hypothetical protein
MKKIFLKTVLILIFGAKLTAQTDTKFFIREPNQDAVIIDQKNFRILSSSEFEKKLKSIKYIPLISKSHIGVFQKIMFYNDKIYVFDSDFKSIKICIFNLNGEQIKIITGKKFKEYFMDAVISEKENCLIVLGSSSMLYFTPEGQFIKKTKGVMCNEISICNSKIFNNMTHAMMTVDLKRDFNLAVSEEDKIVRQGFQFYPLNNPANEAKRDIVFHNNYKKELLFSPSLSDTVYQILNESTFSVKYIVEQEKSIWKKSNEKLTSDECDNLQKQSGYTYRTGNFLETENFVNYSVSYWVPQYNIPLSFSFWYDKRTKMSFVIGHKNQDIQEDESNNSVILLDTVIITGYKSVKDIIPNPLTVCGNKYAGVFSNTAGLKKALKNPESYESKYFKNEEVKNMVSKTKNLDAILILYELE